MTNIAVTLDWEQVTNIAVTLGWEQLTNIGVTLDWEQETNIAVTFDLEQVHTNSNINFIYSQSKGPNGHIIIYCIYI